MSGDEPRGRARADDAAARGLAGGGAPAAASEATRRSGSGSPPAEDGGRRSDDGDGPICDVCGARMYERHCKILCPVCGYQRDCSDP